MKKWKKILLSTAVFATLIIIGFISWLFQLHNQVAESLAKKTFSAPVSFWSSQYLINLDSNYNVEQVSEIFLKRGYRLREKEQSLRPGDFKTLAFDGCPQQISNLAYNEDLECLQFKALSTVDPFFKTISDQVIVFEKNKISQFFYFDQSQVIHSVDFVALEPTLIAKYLGEAPVSQIYTPLGEIPSYCSRAVIAIEDNQFLEHKGFSTRGLLRAIKSNVLGGPRQGGSTITQQLVKNYFLTAERTFKRKFIELFMSLILENVISKDEILETYLNIIYLGQNGSHQIIGFPAASQYYFQKSIQDLEIHECALLAAVLNNPGFFDPFKHPDRALKRRTLVLSKMKDLGFISEDEYKDFQAKTMPVSPQSFLSETAPYYLSAVKQELKEKKITELSGLTIFTGMNLDHQDQAQQAVASHLKQIEQYNKKVKTNLEKGKKLEATFTVVNNNTGCFSAIIGGRNFRLSQFNRAIDGKRQVGSITKPFVYLSALENEDKYNPQTIIEDSPFTHSYQGQKWSPKNYGGKFFGPIPMYFGLKNSLNLATASLGLQIGVDSMISTARRFLVESEIQDVPSTLLGSFELTNQEVVTSYLGFAKLGLLARPTTLRSVVDKQDVVIFENKISWQQVFPAHIIAKLVGMMKHTNISGTAKLIHLNGFQWPSAGKTGTTSDSKDAWYAGFTKNFTGVVWVGYDQPENHSLTGASAAVPIWLNAMKEIHSNLQPKDWTWPEKNKVEKVPTFMPSTDDEGNTIENLNKENLDTIELVM